MNYNFFFIFCLCVNGSFVYQELNVSVHHEIIDENESWNSMNI